MVGFQEPVTKLGDESAFIGLFWKGACYRAVERGPGFNSSEAAGTRLFLWHDELTFALRVLSDFQTFELYDLEDNTASRFTLRQLPDHIEEFGFIPGVQKRSFRDNCEAGLPRQ